MKSALKQLPELTQRIIAAVIGATAIISAIAWSEWTYFVVFFIICLFTILEFYKLLGVDGQFPLRTYGTMLGLSLFSLTFLIEKGMIPSKYYLLWFIALALAFMIKLYRRQALKPFTNVAFTFLGVIYVAVPFSLLNLSIFYDGQYHFGIILGSLFIIWGSDTGAYFSGRMFGRRKLFARVSPKKTWEGFIGGCVFALGIGILFSYYFSDLNRWQWIAISIVIAVTGTYGDLVESLFKRSIAIKDSGTAIPGHGGFLDRFDSLLLASPFIVAFVKFFD